MNTLQVIRWHFSVGDIALLLLIVAGFVLSAPFKVISAR